MNAAYPISVLIQSYWKEKPQFVIALAYEPEWIMFVVENGRFTYQIDNVDGEATTGDIVLCPPFTPFRREITVPLSFHYFKFRLQVQGSENQAETSSIE